MNKIKLAAVTLTAAADIATHSKYKVIFNPGEHFFEMGHYVFYGDSARFEYPNRSHYPLVSRSGRTYEEAQAFIVKCGGPPEEYSIEPMPERSATRPS